MHEGDLEEIEEYLERQYAGRSFPAWIRHHENGIFLLKEDHEGGSPLSDADVRFDKGLFRTRAGIVEVDDPDDSPWDRYHSLTAYVAAEGA